MAADEPIYGVPTRASLDPTIEEWLSEGNQIVFLFPFWLIRRAILRLTQFIRLPWQTAARLAARQQPIKRSGIDLQSEKNKLPSTAFEVSCSSHDEA
jgi:hypothetical protein